MEIIFDKRPGQIFDMFQSLFFVYNDCADEQLNKYGLTWDKQHRKAYDLLRKTINTKKDDSMDLFFNKDVHTFWMFFNSPVFWEVKTINEFFKRIGSYAGEELRHKIFKHLNSLKEGNFQNTMHAPENDEQVVQYLNSLHLPASIKWSALNFLHNPEGYMKNVMGLLNDYADSYKTILENNENCMNKFNSVVEEKIHKQGVEFLKSEIQELLSLDQCESIYVSTAYLCNFAGLIDTEDDGKTFYVNLGIDYNEALKHVRGKNEKEHMLNVLKVLSDPTRFEIINLLMQKSYYGQELAEKLGLTMATVSHHMEQLHVVARVVKADISGHRVYYSVNRDELKKCMDFLKNKFSL